MELIQVDTDQLVNIEQFPKYQYIIGWRIAFYIILVLHVWSNYNWKAIVTCCDKSDGLSHGKLRAVSQAQKGILQRTSLGRQLK